MFTTSEVGDAGPFLSAPEAARRLLVTPRTIRRWATEGTLEAELVGTRYRIREAALRRMIRPAHVAEDAGE